MPTFLQLSLDRPLDRTRSTIFGSGIAGTHISATALLNLHPQQRRRAFVDIMYTISNIYVLAAFGTIGGALFGFDVSSMSAWIDQDQYLEYFNHPDANMQGGVSNTLQSGMETLMLTFPSVDHSFDVWRIVHWCSLRWFHR